MKRVNEWMKENRAVLGWIIVLTGTVIAVAINLL